MLFLLSDNIETDKTHWLEGLVNDLEASGVEACGVLAPDLSSDIIKPDQQGVLPYMTKSTPILFTMNTTKINVHSFGVLQAVFKQLMGYLFPPTQKA